MPINREKKHWNKEHKRGSTRGSHSHGGSYRAPYFERWGRKINEGLAARYGARLMDVPFGPERFPVPDGRAVPNAHRY